MPNAPTPEQLGGMQRLSGSRPVASYDVSPVARGAQDIAEAGTRLGQTIADIGQSTAPLGRLARLSEATDTNAYIHARLIGIRQRYDSDPDYATLAQRWDDEAGRIIDDGLSRVSDENLRARMLDDLRAPLAQEQAAIQDQAFRGAADAHAANRQAYLQNLVAHSSLDPNDAVMAGAIDAYHALIDNAVDRGYQTPDGAVAEKRNAALALCAGEYSAMARTDPARAIRQLDGSEDGHPLVDQLPPDRRDALIGDARASQDADTLDVADASRLGALQVQRASDAAETAILNDRLSDNPTITAKAIANNAALTPQARGRMLGLIARAGEPDPSEETSAATAIDLLDRVRRRDGDPDKIASIAPLVEAYNAGGLRREDFAYVARQLAEAQTPEGEALARKRQAFVMAAAPPAGSGDGNGGSGSDEPDQDRSQGDAIGALPRYDLERDLDQKIDQYRKEGKDPNDLFDPGERRFPLGAELLSTNPQRSALPEDGGADTAGTQNPGASDNAAIATDQAQQPHLAQLFPLLARPPILFGRPPNIIRPPGAADNPSNTPTTRPFKEPIPGLTPKEAATDVPSWARGKVPYVGESGKPFAKRLMDDQHGPGKWEGDPVREREFRQIQKWGDRHFRDPKQIIILPDDEA